MPVEIIEINKKVYRTEILEKYEDLQRLIERKYLNVPRLWRGQKDSDWELKSTLTRGGSEMILDDILIPHLYNFKNGLLGKKIGINMEGASDDEMWALGQHHSLKTPLLDWSSSPYIYIFFAFFNPTESKFVSLYALDHSRVNQFLKTTGNDEVKILEPTSHYNQRLINQQGKFTFGPTDGESFETWVEYNFDNEEILVEYLIPSKERDNILRHLNLMNINPQTIFPDEDGAAHYANLALEIDNY